MALADNIVELETNSLCLCGEKAKFNARKIDGEFTFNMFLCVEIVIIKKFTLGRKNRNK